MYAAARWNRDNIRDAWRIYIAEGIRTISESSAKFFGGPYITAKWLDIINPQPEETRTAEEVIDHVLRGLKKLAGS